MRVDVRGVIVPNDDKWIYDLFEYESTCLRDITNALNEADGGDVNVYVSSGGGDLYTGMDMCAALRDYSGSVYVHITSHAHSAAGFLCCAGTSDILPGGLIMLHQASAGVRGNSDDMRKQANVLDKHDEAIAALYMGKTGMSREQILDLMSKETFLTAQEAVDMGFVDRIAEETLRPVAAASPMIPPEVLNKIRAMKAEFNPPQADFSMEKIQAKLNLLKLGGVR